MGVALGPVPQHSGGGGTSKETCVVVQQVKLLPAVLAPPIRASDPVLGSPLLSQLLLTCLRKQWMKVLVLELLPPQGGPGWNPWIADLSLVHTGLFEK